MCGFYVKTRVDTQRVVIVKCIQSIKVKIKVQINLKRCNREGTRKSLE